MLLIPLLYLSSLGWVLERDQVGSSSMVRSIPSAIFPYLGATHKRNPRGKTPLPSEVVPYMSPTKMPKMTSLKAQLSAAIAIAEAIRELKEVPSGHLYARVNQHMTLDAYNRIILALKTAGLVKEQNFLLTWIGPT